MMLQRCSVCGQVSLAGSRSPCYCLARHRFTTAAVCVVAVLLIAGLAANAFRLVLLLR